MRAWISLSTIDGRGAPSQERMKNSLARYTPLQIAVHVGAWLPLARLIFDLLTDALSANPTQDLQLGTGRAAITLLVLTLACTPLNTLFGWREPVKRRRALGLYAFMYATIHMLIFVELDYGLAWSLITRTILEKPYLVVGVTTFLLLLPLAATSFDIWKRRLGKNWTRLHRTVYFTASLAVLHYAWSKKGDLFTLQGDIVRPLADGIVLALLLALRIPAVRRAVASWRFRLAGLSARAKAGPVLASAPVTTPGAPASQRAGLRPRK
jgi:sulfoxide reductase heme-binding subunit YedZ